MDVYRRLLQQAPSYLKPGGVLLMEVGAGQAASVCRQAEENGWFRVYDVLRDEGEIDRVVCCERKSRWNGPLKRGVILHSKLHGSNRYSGREATPRRGSHKRRKERRAAYLGLDDSRWRRVCTVEYAPGR